MHKYEYVFDDVYCLNICFKPFDSPYMLYMML